MFLDHLESSLGANTLDGLQVITAKKDAQLDKLHVVR